MRTAVVQMRSTPDVDANLASAERLTARAAERGATFVMLPEAFAFIGPDAQKQEITEPLPDGGPILERCRRLAAKHRVHLLLGGFHERSGEKGKAYNTGVHLDTTGAIVSCYRKIHLFDVDLADGTRLNESDRTIAGKDVVVTPTPFGPLGLTICYDVRFPALYQQLVDKGAIALTVPSAFTLSTGKDHWHVLLRARAIECQAYVLAPAQWGHHHGNRTSYGHALIVDPWGCVIAECGDGDGVAIADLETAVVAEARKRLPSLEHRRLK
ncbi:MAG TPA: carbon-nitrogen hydrolase family protein [Pseudomonadales bacterium]